MWCYRIPKSRESSDETPAEAEARLRTMRGVVAVEVLDVVTHPEMAGVIYVRAFVSDACRSDRKTGADDPDQVRDDLAALLIEHPEALPGTCTMCWLDVGGAIAEHLSTDQVAIRAEGARRAGEMLASPPSTAFCAASSRT